MAGLRTIVNDRLVDGLKLDNLPADTNTELANLQSELDAHEARSDNPHSVTKAQVGLSNVDNTSDANKPISTATQSALDAKVDDVIAGTNTTVQRNGNTITVNSTGGGGGGSGNEGSFAHELQTATASQTVFNISFDYVLGNNLYVFVNGQKQIYTEDYNETDTNTVTFVSGLNAGDMVEFIYPNKGVNYKGTYNGATAYLKDDAVYYDGSSYIAIQDTTGNLPTNATYWGLLVSNGGNMYQATYDPQGIEADAFDRANHTGTQSGDTIVGGIPTQIDRIEFDISPTATTNTEGKMIWNPTDKCLDIYDGETKLQVGQEIHVVAYNNTGSTILNGKAVYISGANGARPTIALAKADSQTTSDAILGVTTQDIPNNSEGKVTIAGLVNNIDTSSFVAGDAVYLSSTTAGSYTSTQPQSPNWLVHLGHVIIVNASTGSIFVDPNVITQTANSVRITSGTGVTEMNNVQDFFRHSWSSGVTEGCEITDNGNGTVSIASGEGLFRTTDADDGVLMPLVIPAQLNIALTDLDVNYLYVNYNGGSPTWVVTTTINDFNGLTKIVGFKIARDGNMLNIQDLRKINVDSNRKARRQNAEWDGYAYQGYYRSILGTSVISHVGTRNISVAAGRYWHWWNAFTHNTFNTSTGSTFTRFYNRSSYTKTAGLTQVDNTNYDNAGVLTAMTNNRYRADDWFIVLGDSTPYIAKIMGNSQHVAESDARNAPFPANLPQRIDGACVYLGRTTILKNAASFTAYHAGSFNLTTGTPSDINSIGGTPLLVSNGGTGATTLTGVVIGNGTSAFTTVSAPSGAIVGTTDSQALTNKTINGVSITNGGSGALTVTGPASVIGTNTGDQTMSNGTTVVATGSQTVVTTPTYTIGNAKLEVYVNGLLQELTEDYTETSTSSITFTTGLNAGDRVFFKLLS